MDVSPTVLTAQRHIHRIRLCRWAVCEVIVETLLTGLAFIECHHQPGATDHSFLRICALVLEVHKCQHCLIIVHRYH